MRKLYYGVNVTNGQFQMHIALQNARVQLIAMKMTKEQISKMKLMRKMKKKKENGISYIKSFDTKFGYLLLNLQLFPLF